MDNTATKTKPVAKTRKATAASAAPLSSTETAVEVEFARYITARGRFFDARDVVTEAPPEVRPLFARIN